MKSGKSDILVSFDLVSLFTKVHILNYIEIVKHKVNEEVATLVELFLRSTLFSFQGVRYEQVKGVAMDSHLSLVIANLYMEYFKEMVLHSFPFKPKWWKRYVDDTNVCWPHGTEKLEEFFSYLNSVSPCISFTKELDSKDSLPFLDLLLSMKSDSSLDRQVFCKATHTNLYLHSLSHHHPHQKARLLRTLSLRALRICDDDNIEQEFSHPHQVFRVNGYSNKHISKAFQ